MPCCMCKTGQWGENTPPVVYDDLLGETQYCVFHAPKDEKRKTLGSEERLSTEEFNELVFARIDEVIRRVNAGETNAKCYLNDVVFPDDIKFEQYGIGKPFPAISFNDATFCSDAEFSNAEFRSDATFMNTKFFCNAKFKKTRFMSQVLFNNTEFRSDASFSEAKFEFPARFEKARFEKAAEFKGVNFKAKAEFVSAKFLGQAEFGGTNFEKEAGFQEAVFTKKAYFKAVGFRSETGFGWAKFSEEAEFGESEFTGIVVFELTEFHSNAVFNRVAFSGAALFKNTKFGDEAAFLSATTLKDGSVQMLDMQSASLEHLTFTRVELPLFAFHNCSWPARLGLDLHGEGDAYNLQKCEELYRAMRARAAKESDQKRVSEWHFREKLMQLKGLLLPGARALVDRFEDYELGAGARFRAWRQLFYELSWKQRCSLLFLYWTCSGFGERHRRAWWCLFVLAVLPLVMLIALKRLEPGLPWPVGLLSVGQDIAEWVRGMPLVKLDISTVSGASVLSSLRTGMSWLFQVVIALQAALFALAVRNHYRR